MSSCRWYSMSMWIRRIANTFFIPQQLFEMKWMDCIDLSLDLTYSTSKECFPYVSDTQCHIFYDVQDDILEWAIVDACVTIILGWVSTASQHSRRDALLAGLPEKVSYETPTFTFPVIWVVREPLLDTAHEHVQGARLLWLNSPINFHRCLYWDIWTVFYCILFPHGSEASGWSPTGAGEWIHALQSPDPGWP